MNLLKKVLSALVVLAGAGLGLWFYLDNMTPVTVILFGHPIENMQLALWLIVSFVAGALLGLSVSAWQSMRHQMHLQLLKKQLTAAKQKSAVKAA